MTNYGFEYNVEEKVAQLSVGDRSVGISYPNAKDDISLNTRDGAFVMEGVWDGVNVSHKLFGSSLHVIFSLSEGSTANMDLEFSPSVTLKQGSPGVVVAEDAKGTQIASIVFGEMTDDTGMSGKAPKVQVSGSGSRWSIVLDGAGDWISSSSRVRPIAIPISLAFSVPTPEIASLARITEVEGESELYRDTRPDSAIQFYVEFYDDEQFRRIRGKKEGVPVCSTVPFGIGDIWDFDDEDTERWEDGQGYESRTVYLLFVASKEVPLGTKVYYDVVTPGTVDYYGKEAQPTDMLVDGLPVFKGSFIVRKDAPPAYADGTGYINVYAEENRTKNLPMSVQVLGRTPGDLLEITLSVTDGTKGGIGLPIDVDVHALGRKELPITILVSQGGSGSSAKLLELKLNVLAAAPGSLLYDRFDSFGYSGYDISA